MTAAKTTAKPKAAKPATKPAADAIAPPAPDADAAVALTPPPALAADQAAQAPALDAPTDTAPAGPTADYLYAEGFTLDENGDVVDAEGVALPPVFEFDDGTAMVLQALVKACLPAVAAPAQTAEQRAQSAVESLSVSLDAAAASLAVEQAVSEMLSQAVADVMVERKRQIGRKGYSAERDDQYSSYELPRAAACYVMNASGIPRHRALIYWPFTPVDFKPSDRRRDLVKATALLLAEIERIDRAEAGE
jgi:hypothetical protein